MISALVFSNNTPLTNYARGVCAMSEEISIAGTLDTVRTGYPIARQLSAWAPELVLLDIGAEDMRNRAAAVVLQIQTESPAAAIVTICSQRDPHVQELAETLGLVPPLAPPFTSDDLETAAIDALGATMDAKRGFLAVFAPARPGSGATTVALNAAWQVARNPNFRTLFIEADEEMGALSILLDNGDIGTTIGDDQGFLTEAGFKQHVRLLGPLHVITGVRLRALTKMKRWAVLRLVACARSCYDFVFIRVPSLVHAWVKPLLSIARKICITATPDVPSLAMARRRCAELRQKIEPARVVLVVNRCNGDVVERQLRDLLDHDKIELVPDAPRQVRQSYRESGVVEVGGPFAQAIHSLASAVTGRASACPPPPAWPALARLARFFSHEGD
jgi:MinD-like ATPase involved in chromosome partitioning or flagellar assembly